MKINHKFYGFPPTVRFFLAVSGSGKSHFVTYAPASPSYQKVDADELTCVKQVYKELSSLAVSPRGHWWLEPQLLARAASLFSTLQFGDALYSELRSLEQKDPRHRPLRVYTAEPAIVGAYYLAWRAATRALYQPPHYPEATDAMRVTLVTVAPWLVLSQAATRAKDAPWFPVYDDKPQIEAAQAHLKAALDAFWETNHSKSWSYHFDTRFSL